MDIRKAGEFLRSNMEDITDDIFDAYIDLREKKGRSLDEGDRPLYRKGIEYHLSFLSESMVHNRSDMFSGALDWGKKYIARTHIPLGDIDEIIETMHKVFSERIPGEYRSLLLEHLKTASIKLKETSLEIPSNLDKQSELYEKSVEYLEALLGRDKRAASKLVLELAEKGIPINRIYIDIFQATQNELGRLWQLGKITVAQEHYSTAVTQLIMSQLYQYIFRDKKGDHTFVGACANGELHEIGLRMVSDLLELDGWDTIYLGANVPAESILETVLENKAEVLGLSATISFNMSKIQQIINIIRDSPEAQSSKIIVGGFAFVDAGDLWKDLGADCFGKSAVDAIPAINKMVS